MSECTKGEQLEPEENWEGGGEGGENLENKEAPTSHSHYFLEDSGTCSRTQAQCIKEIRSLEIRSPGLTFFSFLFFFRVRRRLHNQILLC